MAYVIENGTQIDDAGNLDLINVGKFETTSIWKGTLAQYNAIAVKDSDILYFVTQ